MKHNLFQGGSMLRINLLGVAAVAAVFAVSVTAQTWNCGYSTTTPPTAAVTATLSEGTLTISGRGDMMDFPNYPSNTWRDSKSSIIRVIINDGVTSVGEKAFNGHTSLTSVTIPNSVTSIKNAAFFGCIGLASVTIPDGVEIIGEDAFARCTSLTSVTIPGNVIRIGGDRVNVNGVAFDGCTGLTNIEVDNGNTVYSSIDGVLFNKSQDTLLNYPAGRQGAYIIPDGVTVIGAQAFNERTNLTSVIIPNSVISIGSWAFDGCTGLTSLTIPNSVAYIGGFTGCTGLTSVTILDGATAVTLGSWAFSGCTGLTSVTIPNSVTFIDYGAFNECTGLTSVTIPNSVATIEHNAFDNCINLTSVTIPNSVTYMGYEAFRRCYRLTSVTIPNSVDSIKGGTFGECRSLTSIISLRAVPPAVVSSAFNGVPYSACLYVPETVKDAYSAANVWKDFECIKSLDEYVSVKPVSRPKQGATSFPRVSVKGRTLNISSPTNSVYNIRLVDMRGRTSARFSASGSGSFSLSKLPSGRYIA